MVNIGSASGGQVNTYNTKQAGSNGGISIGQDERGLPVERKKIDEKVNLESFQGLLDNVNREMEPHNTQLEFSVHEKTKQVMIKVVDTGTKETIREIPSEKLMDIMANLLEVAGILVDIKA